jgi:3-hexulose-6-phosphate synthase/6-phospho-3-hexuloisomerase
VDDKALEQFVDAIIGAKKIFAYGVGRSGLVAKAFSVTLMPLAGVAGLVASSVTAVMPTLPHCV